MHFEYSFEDTYHWPLVGHWPLADHTEMSNREATYAFSKEDSDQTQPSASGGELFHVAVKHEDHEIIHGWNNLLMLQNNQLEMCVNVCDRPTCTESCSLVIKVEPDSIFMLRDAAFYLRAVGVNYPTATCASLKGYKMAYTIVNWIASIKIN